MDCGQKRRNNADNSNTDDTVLLKRAKTTTVGGCCDPPPHDAAHHTLVCKALEIVLQHWLVPSDNFKGWSSVLNHLKVTRLPIVREHEETRKRNDRNNDMHRPTEDEHHLPLTQSFPLINETCNFDFVDLIDDYAILQSVDVASEWVPLMRAAQSTVSV